MGNQESCPPDGSTKTDSDRYPDAAARRVVTVPIDALRPGDTPRLDGISPEHVQLLAMADADLPPLLVERATMRVIDGMHRLQAAIVNGRRTIEVEFFTGSEREMFAAAVRANIGHGRPLTLADRRAAAERLVRLYPEWSDRRVAATVGLSDKTVAAVRRSCAPGIPQPDWRVGRDGRTRPLSSTAGRRIASELIEERPQASLREIARQAGISVATVRDVRERLRRGDGPVPGLHAVPRPMRLPAGQPGAGQVEVGRPAPAIARPGAGDSAADEGVEEADGRYLLEGLNRDPSLRYSELGRGLLRWLDQRTVRPTELECVVQRVPPHAAVIVARVARLCAASWESLAQEMELRASE